MARQVRRIITGTGADGRSRIVMDGPAPHVRQRSPGSTIVTQIWQTEGGPADIHSDEDPTLAPYTLSPPAGGSVCRIIVYPPDAERLPSLALEHAQTQDDGSGRTHALDRGPSRHPGFHKTHTIDYAIVLSGRIWALMDEGETLMEAGDVLVQRATNHAWSNRDSEPAVLAFVLIDARAPSQVEPE